MPTKVKVVFRFYGDEWEAYGIDHSAYGYGKTLSEARRDIVEALVLLLEVEPSSIVLDEFHERCVYKESPDSPAIWVRTFQDKDSAKLLRRREMGEKIKSMLEERPEYSATFRNGQSTMGDVVATICFDEDLFVDLLSQIGGTGRLFVGMPVASGILWQCVFTDAVEDKPRDAVEIVDLGLSATSTVGDFMRISHADEASPKDFLVAA